MSVSSPRALRFLEGLKKKKLIEEIVFYEPRSFSVEEKIRYTARNACVVLQLRPGLAVGNEHPRVA